MNSSDGLDTQNPGFEFWKHNGEMSLRQVEQGFCHNFGIFDDLSKLRNFQKPSNSSMPKHLANNFDLP